MALATEKNKQQPEKGAARKRAPRKSAQIIVGLYVLAGSLWILFSDNIVHWFIKDNELVKSISIEKGLLYVLVTAVILYLLVRRALRTEAAYSAETDRSYAILQENYALSETSRKVLAESEDQYRQLFNAMLYGWCVNELVYGGDGQPVDVRTVNHNPACRQIAGWDPDTVEECNLFKLLPGVRSFWLDGFRAVVREGRTMRFHVYSEYAGKYLEFTVYRSSPGRFAAVFNDVTDRKQMEKTLDAETEQLRVTLDSIGDGVIAVDNEGRVTMANGVAEELTGWHNGASLGKAIGEVLELFGGQSGLAFAAMASSVFGHGESAAFTGDMRLLSRDGIERIISGRAAPMKGSGGELIGLVFVFRDVTAQHTKEAEILYLNYHDTLTGLYNRTFFEEELRRLDTARQLPLSIIMGDANNLKLVNDVFGHREGDELIRVMACALKESCRAEDIISRWGGDEFTILLPRTDAEGAAQVCRRILEKCRECHTQDKRLSPSLSLGYDTKISPEADVAYVIKAAEDMMYKNKLLDSRTAHNDFLLQMRARIGQGDLESQEHTGRVSELCERTGREMNMKEPDLADLKTLSLLHDIGKAAIDSRILNKPGSLTDDEWEEIKRHSGIGYRIVRSAPELVLVADYILGHHERWDGEGYPQGLRGESIPLASRILSVVEAFDVMTRGRPYKSAVSQEEAIRELFRNAGAQFDPEVVNAFVSVLDDFVDNASGSGN